MSVKSKNDAALLHPQFPCNLSQSQCEGRKLSLLSASLKKERNFLFVLCFFSTQYYYRFHRFSIFPLKTEYKHRDKASKWWCECWKMWKWFSSDFCTSQKASWNETRKKVDEREKVLDSFSFLLFLQPRFTKISREVSLSLHSFINLNHSS